MGLHMQIAKLPKVFLRQLFLCANKGREEVHVSNEWR